LAIYGAASGSGVREDDLPVAEKTKLVEQLRNLLGETVAFCKQSGVDVEAMRGAVKFFDRVRVLKDSTDKLTHPLETKKTFLNLAGRVDKTYRSLGLDAQKNEFSLDWGIFDDLSQSLKQLEKPVDISHVMANVERLLDESIDASGYELRERVGGTYNGRVHLGSIDFAALTQWINTTKQKATAAQALAAATRNRAEQTVRLNPTRSNLREELDELIADYNAGTKDVNTFFQELFAFMKKLEAEDLRPDTESLTVEELAFFDQLTAGVTLKGSDREKVKTIARELPQKLSKKLVIDWRKGQRTRAAVKSTINEVLQHLPDAYGDDLFDRTVETIYLHVFEAYYGEGKSKYSGLA
jgi:type I restriction enzyme, R subunit